MSKIDPKSTQNQSKFNQKVNPNNTTTKHTRAAKFEQQAGGLQNVCSEQTGCDGAGWLSQAAITIKRFRSSVTLDEPAKGKRPREMPTESVH